MKMLRSNAYHSPEQSETDSENDEQRCRVVVYDYSWHSDEVRQIIIQLLLSCLSTFASEYSCLVIPFGFDGTIETIIIETIIIQ